MFIGRHWAKKSFISHDSQKEGKGRNVCAKCHGRTLFLAAVSNHSLGVGRSYAIIRQATPHGGVSALHFLGYVARSLHLLVRVVKVVCLITHLHRSRVRFPSRAQSPTNLTRHELQRESTNCVCRISHLYHRQSKYFHAVSGIYSLITRTF